MSILFTSITIQHERRLRLLFSNSLAAGAFTNLALYAVASVDATQPSPSVVAALIVPNTPNAVDVAVDQDLTPGAPYTVTAVGVPASDSTITPAGSVLPFALGTVIAVPNSEIDQDDVDALTYGVDLVHDGTDFVEGPDGDLMTLTGQPLVFTDVVFRELSDGLPWKPSFGGHLRSLIDGPSVGARVRGRLVMQAKLDPRVATVDAVRAAPDPANPGSTNYKLTITPISAGTPTTIPLRVPGT